MSRPRRQPRHPRHHRTEPYGAVCKGGFVLILKRRTRVPRFECEASIHFGFIVTAATKEEAEALLAEQLGPDWEGNFSPADIEHSQIEATTCSTDISCLGP